MVAFWLIRITGRHLRAARGLLGWTQSDLAKKARVGLGTVRRMEGFDEAVGARTDTLGRVVATLEKAGVEFLCYVLITAIITNRTRYEFAGLTFTSAA
jgi:predicted transcriptional regulator